MCAESASGVCGKSVESVQEVRDKCMVESVWKVCGKCLGSVREVSGEAVLEVVGSAELSANTSKKRRAKML